MAEPKGLLVVPVGFRTDGSLHALELDNSDRLKVLIDSITGSVIVTQTTPDNLRVSPYFYDGSTLQKGVGHTDGVQRTAPESHKIFDVSGVAQVGKYGTANNNSVTVYTVPANKKAYITSVYMCISNQSGGGNAMYVEVQDATPAVSFQWELPANNTQIFSATVSPGVPVQLLTGWSMRVRSPVLNLFARLTITGYEL